MKKMIIPVLITGLIATSCKNKNEEVAQTSSTETTQTTTPADSTTAATETPVGDTTQNAVDWNGTYKGTLPCASCPGIETVLTLNSDKTYTLESNYLEQKDGKSTDKGTFEFSADGSFITLKDPKDPAENRVFFVAENEVFMAEKVGDRSAKPEYKLTKQK